MNLRNMSKETCIYVQREVQYVKRHPSVCATSLRMCQKEIYVYICSDSETC